MTTSEIRSQMSEIGKTGVAAIINKIILFALCSLLFAPCSAVEAQQAKKIPRIAFLSVPDKATDSVRFDAIRQRLRELGYIEDKNLAIEYRSAGGKLDRYHELADDLVRLKVDLIVAGGGTIYVQAVKNATKTIPIVMTGPGGDPVKEGLIQSMARPGGNVTGLTNLGRDLGGKRLELLKPFPNLPVSQFSTIRSILPM